jgi:hypothetical protein
MQLRARGVLQMWFEYCAQPIDECEYGDDGPYYYYPLEQMFPGAFSVEEAAIERAMMRADMLEFLGTLTEDNRSTPIVDNQGRHLGLLIVGRSVVERFARPRWVN